MLNFVQIRGYCVDVVSATKFYTLTFIQRISVFSRIGSVGFSCSQLPVLESKTDCNALLKPISLEKCCNAKVL